MGKKGFMASLTQASTRLHVREFSGCTAAIDAYIWLYRGAHNCGDKLARGKRTHEYINYCMTYVDILLKNNIKPVLVLDGRELPSKQHTTDMRKLERVGYRELAEKCLREGNTTEANKWFKKSVEVTPEMGRNFIKKLRSMNIDYVVAPYEADAQLAYMALTGVVDLVITDDSDLIIFGCPRIFFKMDFHGMGNLFESSKLPLCSDIISKPFKFERLRWMHILSGCDYLPALPGIGDEIKLAKKVVDESDNDDIKNMLTSISTILRESEVEITEDYIEGFLRAENTFLYQLVFDTRKRMLLPLNPYPEGVGPEDFPFAGSYHETKRVAVDLAVGNVDLLTLKLFDFYEPLRSGYNKTSIWSPSFQLRKTECFQMDDVMIASNDVGMEKQEAMPVLDVSNKSSMKKSQKRKSRPSVSDLDLHWRDTSSRN